jgi:phage repressor protein C with HTH and peptisase S24 domain
MGGSRLKEIRKKLNLTQSEIGDKLGIPWSRIKDMESGKQKVSPELAELIEDKFSINGWWLLTGKGEMLIGEQCSLPIATNGVEDDDSVSVNYYPDVMAAAGYGAINEGQYIPQPMRLDRKFLEQLVNVRRFDKLDIITVFGDSMEPYISNGETVLIERHDDAKNGETVIANINGSVYIKRIKMDPFKKWVQLMSENSHYEEIALSGDELQYLTIVGIVRAKIRIF